MEGSPNLLDNFASACSVMCILISTAIFFNHCNPLQLEQQQQQEHRILNRRTLTRLFAERRTWTVILSAIDWFDFLASHG